VLLVWVVAIVVLHPWAATLYRVTDDRASANLPASAPSTRVALLLDAGRRGVGADRSDMLAVVFARAGGLSPADLAAIARTTTAIRHVGDATPGLGSTGALRRAPDGQAAVLTMQVTGPALDETRTDTQATGAVRRAISDVGTQAQDGLRVAVTGQAAIEADSGTTTQTGLLLTALGIVAMVLLTVYRSVVLWIFPLLGALGGIVMAQAAAHALGAAGLTVSSLSTSILIVLAFGAASDYALLLIHRYRAELSRHAAVEDAMATALRRTVPTLTASAGTVVGAMLCLLAADSASLHGLGPVGAVAIAGALLAQTTFLPAMLVISGRRAFWPRGPRLGGRPIDGSRVWSHVGAWIARRPGPIAVGALVALGAASLGLLALQVDDSPLANLKGRPPSVVGAQLFAGHLGAGAIAPLTVLAPPQESHAAQDAARATPGVADVAAGPAVGDEASFSVTLSVDPYGTQGQAAVAALRSRLDAAVPGSLVGGDPAIRYDIRQAAGRDARVLIPLVLLVILLVVAALLRAVVAALVLVTTTALSFGASFGLASLLWRYGLGYPGIQAQLPLYVFVFVVALGVDYTIFLAARIREETGTLGTAEATLRGLTATGGVITAAGLALAGTFVALARGPLVDLTEVGTAIALGVLVDTLLVRTVLVPAAFLRLSRNLWWPAPMTV
jgi:RND superfamily putative drug exporter